MVLREIDTITYDDAVRRHLDVSEPSRLRDRWECDRVIASLIAARTSAWTCAHHPEVSNTAWRVYLRRLDAELSTQLGGS